MQALRQPCEIGLTNDAYLLCGILDSKDLIAVYQPILSVVQRRIVGVEGLSRGIDPIDGKLISPLDLFEQAEQMDTRSNRNQTRFCRSDCSARKLMQQYDTWSHRIALDRLCREKCLEGFRTLYERSPETHLFLNLDASIIDAASGSDYLLRQVADAAIPPGNVIIEINESHIREVAPLVQFVRRYRDAGFLIALDDMGAGFSNLDRISLLEPDIIKLDRSLVQGVTRSYHKQEVFRCMVGLANKVGAIVVAEGVETSEELNAAIEFGAHLVQGFCFARPVPAREVPALPLYNKMEQAAGVYMAHMSQKMQSERIRRNEIDRRISLLTRSLEIAVASEMYLLLHEFVMNQANAGVECAYLLDKEGIQATDTVFGDQSGNGSRRRGFVFSPSQTGSDNSLKKYYYELMNAGVGKYVSEPYISHATGSVCVTYSRIIHRMDGNSQILCIDFIQEWNL